MFAGGKQRLSDYMSRIDQEIVKRDHNPLSPREAYLLMLILDWFMVPISDQAKHADDETLRYFKQNSELENRVRSLEVKLSNLEDSHRRLKDAFISANFQS